MAASPPTSPARPKPARRRAFTLVEVLVATTISGFILTGVIAAALHLARSGVRVTHYAEMNTQVQRTFAQLSIDLQSASGFIYNGPTDITVTVAKSDGSTAQFTYALNATTGAFYRVPGASSATSTGRIWLMAGVQTLTFARFDSSGNAAATDAATKRIGVSLTVARAVPGATRATFSAASAFMLRNKSVS